MKTKDLMNALSAEDLRDVSGGAFHIHCTPPKPGTCSCVPSKSEVFANIVQLIMN